MNDTTRRAPWLVLLVAALAAAAWFDLRTRHEAVARQLAELTTRTAEVERAVHLFRFEARSTRGLGAAALLEQLAHWGPKLQSAATPTAEVPQIQQRVDDILNAMGALGPDAADVFEKALRETKSGDEDELRKWLVRAILKVAPARGKSIVIELLRGLEHDVTPRLREFAADELIRIDRELAGRELRAILGYESSGGIARQRVPHELVQRYPESSFMRTTTFPNFYNLVDKYTQTDDPQIENVLLSLFGRSEHDLVTVQAAVKQLGAMRSQRAVDDIKKCFDRPPGISDNPIFRNHCIEALAAIQGAEALPWLQEKLRTEQRDLVAQKLRQTIEELGG